MSDEKIRVSSYERSKPQPREEEPPAEPKAERHTPRSKKPVKILGRNTQVAPDQVKIVKRED